MAGKFNLEDYETVESRLNRFWKDHPQGRVITDLVYHDERRFICKTEIYFDRDDTSPVSTGHAEEIVGASPVNRSSALENCETSSTGRALAQCGYAGARRPSREEMEKVERYAKEPRKPITPPRVYTPEEITKAKLALSEVPIIPTIDEARRVWEINKDILEAPVDGTTLKDALNARVQSLQ